MRTSMATLSLTTGLALIPFCVSAAAAQTAPGPAPATAEATASDQPDIVVTAQKREERIKDVPMTVAAVSSQDLVRRDIRDATALSFAVPGLGAFQVAPGENLLQIRGISGFRGEGSLVGLYLDDAPLSGNLRLGNGSGLDAQTYDLARVEVLKGPQGTLFGEGAIGGVIRYITNDPKLDRVEGQVRATWFATRDGAPSYEGQGMINLPIVTDKLGLRVAATYDSDGGWIDNVGTGEKNFNDNKMFDLRAKLLFEPTARFRVSALADIHRLTYGGQNIVNVGDPKDSLFRQAVLPDYSTHGYNRFNLYNLTASYDFGFATLLSSTTHFNVAVPQAGGYQTQIVPGVGVAPNGGFELLEGTGKAYQRTTGEELRLTSNGSGPFKWIIGGNFKWTRNFQNPFDNTAIGIDVLIPLTPPLVFTNTAPSGTFTNEKSRTYTAFGDVSYTLFDRLTVGGGLRYFHENRDTASFDQPTGALLPNSTLSGSFEKTTYRAYVKYKVSDAVNLYANTATGFRSGGFNSGAAVLIGAPATYNPETSIFYEAGIKTRFLGGRVSFDLAGFTGKFKNQINLAVYTDPANPANIQGYYRNAGIATIKGFDWDLSVIPVPGLTLSFSGDYLKTRFTSVLPGEDVVVGDPIDFVPEYDLVFSGNYNFHWAANVAGYLNLNYSVKGPMQNSNRASGYGFPINRTDPLNFLQAQIGATVGGFELSVFARNILDERGVLSPQFSGIRPQARPRTIGFTIGKNF